MSRAEQRRGEAARRGRAALALTGCAAAVVLGMASTAHAGAGEGYFFAGKSKDIPDGHGDAKLRLQSALANDADPVINYVSLSLRINHPRTRDLKIKLERPDFAHPDNSGVDRVVKLSDRDTSGRNLGKKKCPASNPLTAPGSYTTLNDFGGPPYPGMGAASPSLMTGSAPYKGVFASSEPLSNFNGYHAAPTPMGEDPVFETWTLIVKDVKDGKSGTLRCAVLYLHRF